jgi:hypothetical protein
MLRKGCKVPIIVVTLGLFFTPTVFAGTSVIEVDLDNATTNPEFPAVNNWSADTILIKIKGRQDLAKQDEIGLTIDVPDPSLYQQNSFTTVFGRFVTLTVQRCAEAPAKTSCPSAQANHSTSSWNVFSPARAFAVKIFKIDRTGPKPILESLMSFPIQVEQKPFGLDFSAGFAGFGGIADKRYHLVAIDEDSENAKLVPATDKDLPYQIAALAHYMPHKWKGIQGPSVGLSTKIPMEDLTIMLGWSFSARTLPVINTGYLTIGAAYVKRNRLRADFEGRDTVPANLSVDTVVEKSYGVGAFIALSFGFFGGADEFKGVFPASKKDK